jgi:hypothetical protein
MTSDIHHVPGRLRVKTPLLRQNPDAALRVRSFLNGVKGVLAHQAKPLTGSIIIHYDTAQIEAHDLLDLLQQQGLLAAVPALPSVRPMILPTRLPASAVALSPPRLPQALSVLGSSLGAALGKALFGLAVEKLVERSAMILIKAVL